MEYENVAFALMVISALTGLIVQGIKMVLAENHIVMQKPNTVAGVVSILLSVAIGAGYVIWTCTAWTIQIVLTLIALAVLSWLCSMLGYDKVIQTIKQYKW